MRDALRIVRLAIGLLERLELALAALVVALSRVRQA
jgi:hypothetical protein